LAQELHAVGVKVSVIMPGFFKTNLLASGNQRGLEESKKIPEMEKIYGSYSKKMNDVQEKICNKTLFLIFFFNLFWSITWDLTGNADWFDIQFCHNLYIFKNNYNFKNLKHFSQISFKSKYYFCKKRKILQ
jgi:hypothetical protein